MNADTLVAVHCWQGDAHLVEAFLPQYLHHETPVVVLSPADSPVRIDHDGVECRSAGPRAYFGQNSLDRQREHLRILLTYPQRFFLLNDADSMCLSPELPSYLYAQAPNTLWSNEVKEGRPHRSPYPKLGVHPPYFVTRETIEKLLTVDVPAHPITPFIDWYMLALACESGVLHRSYPDGRSFPAWRHGAIPETKELGHDYVHEQTSTGVDGGRRMAQLVATSGVVFVHSVKHPEVRDQLVAAFARRRVRPAKPRPAPPKPAPALPLEEGQLSILVAFRDADGSRTRLWDFVRERFERLMPQVQIVVGTDDGEDPFHKTLAINRAAREATGEVLGIWDVDTWIDPAWVEEAARQCLANPNRWVRPYRQKLKCNEAATAYILSLGAAWDGTIDHKPFGKPESRSTFWPAPPLVLHRSAFDIVHGLDERFRGWLGEDVAFQLALDKLVGPGKQLRAEAIHLCHERRGKSGRDLWVGQTNTAPNDELVKLYRGARTAEDMRRLIQPVSV